MAYRVEFAGINLHEYCTILNVERSVLPPRTNHSKEIPTMNGSFYTGYHYGERNIGLEVYIHAKTNEEYMRKVRELADAIHTDAPCKLYIMDEPNKYYYAVVDGTTELDRTVFSGTLQINFICHDPIAYSDEWKTFEPNERNIVTVENNGTTDTNMNVKVEFNNDACFFQMTNRKGETVLIGKPKDATQANKKATTTIVKDTCETTANFTSLSETLLDANRFITGGFTVGNNGTAIVCNNYGTVEEKTWGGAAFRRNLGKNLEQFEVTVTFNFTSKGDNYKPSATAGTVYQVNAKSGLYIRSIAGTTGTKLAILPYGTKITPISTSGKWIKHTTKVGTKTFTGWSHSDYLTKISTGSKATTYAEDELGILEIYGYDQNGTKLFKGMVDDANAYYEYVKPRIYIGSSKVLSDDSAAPTPRKVTTKDEDGKSTTTSAASGVYGNWNDLYGKLVIKRTKNAQGTYLWNITLYSIKNGQIVQTLATSNSLSSAKYPTGDLSYLGFFIGKYGEYRAVDLISIQQITVKDLSPVVQETENPEIFESGDELNIDFDNGLVTINNKVALNHIDIGTEFFKVPSGNSQIAIKTDDASADISVGIQERYL